MTASGLAHKAIAERYELIGEVGQGGMATVYLGRDLVLGREVAVKILHNHLAKDPEHRRRFRREARTTARLQHPNIVKIFDFADQESRSAEGQGGDSPVYLVMEFIKGKTLQQVVEEKEFPLCELAVALVEQIAEALEHAHEQHVIHRDLKPENVLIQDDGTVKLTDFGLARILDGESMTRTGTILGSPAYMAPEQIEGKSGDHRVDLFALGVILYRLACQQHPFDLSNPMAILKAVGSGSFRDPEAVRPGIGRQLARIIKRAMSLDPEKRYGSVKEMREALRKYLEEAGIEEPAVTVQGYLLGHDDMVEKLQARVILFLKASARRLARQKRFAAALDRCNRVLSLDPEESDTHSLIRRLSQQERWGQVYLWAGAAAMVIGLVIGGWYFTQTNGRPGTFIGDGADLTHTSKGAKKHPDDTRAARKAPKPTIARAKTPERRVKPKRTLCRIAIPRGRGRYYDLLDFNLGFQLALRGSKRRPMLAIKLKKRRKHKAGLIQYSGPVWVSIDGGKGARLSRRRTRRIPMKVGQEHNIEFHFPKFNMRRVCETYIPLRRPVRSRPKPRKRDPDVQKEPPPAGPKRKFQIKINTHFAGVRFHNNYETPVVGYIHGRKRTFSLASNRIWTMILRGRRWIQPSRWELDIPIGKKLMVARQRNAQGEVVLQRSFQHDFTSGVPSLLFQLKPKTAILKIGCYAPNAILAIGRESEKNRVNLGDSIEPIRLNWGWERWTEIFTKGVRLRIGADKYHMRSFRLYIKPGQTKNLGMIRLRPKKPKISKRIRRAKRTRPPKRRPK